MPKSVQMPQLGESVTEGTVTRWLKKEGERVEADEPLLEVSTDKVDTEIPSPAAGILTKIVVAEDETVEVGAELAVIDENGTEGAAAPAQETAPEPEPEPAPQQQAQPVSSIPQPAPQQAPAPQQQAPAPAQAQQAPAPAQAPPAPQAAPPSPIAASEPVAQPSGDSPYVTPLVRKLAGEHGVDLDALTGTGVGGRIRKQDVLEAARAQRERASAAQAQPQAPQAAAQAPAQAAPQAPEPIAVDTTLRGRTEKMSRLRQTIAKRMVESLQVSAQLTTVVEVDVTKIARLRDQAKAEFQRREGVKLTFTPFFALATIEALKQHPKLNATINSETNEVTYFDTEHLGFATDTERGLLVPVIKDAGDLNIAGLSRKIADLAERTRTNKVSPDEITGGTFTLTNTGSRGALFDTPILNQPQVGMLGTGAVVKRPVVLDTPEGEVIAVRSMMYLALSYDHRLVDGADAARFLTTIKRRLEEGRFENQLGLHG
ncbi:MULTISPECIES: 2-oxoglutarate dehydrogenase, E2 component, dihydrolipoamide succinyltransferase [unclassified Streptosporangium]|uniref:2-oxoglutarate dehydrogenase, E2 component, dihydrolipoamide succinyltransferase n=1 Tax=unclassified Streptosporangium TaxID=2632669 RepID=UPI002E2D31AF|nr:MULTISPECIES: 2-oxoglutarate dehydrogenase, E2 component, dihydrolipoamide succinyltransferase [unclassified Streptosporangium]